MNIEIRKVEVEELKGTLFLEFVEEIRLRSIDENPECRPQNNETITQWLDAKDERYDRFLAFDGDRIVGDVELNTKPDDPTEANRTLGYINGFVQQEYRGHGIATKLLIKSLSLAKSLGITAVRIGTWGKDGESLCKKLEGQVVARGSDKVLYHDACNWNAVNSWLSTLDGKDWLVEVHNTITNQLVDDLVHLTYETDGEFKTMYKMDWTFTLEDERNSWKEKQEFYQKTDTGYYCIIIKDNAGKVLGYTEGSVQKGSPETFYQNLTTVQKSRRCQGIGKLLKALMLNYIRKNMPQIKKQITSNNDVNTPILEINRMLGFTVINEAAAFRIDIERALEIFSLRDAKDGNPNNFQG